MTFKVPFSETFSANERTILIAVFWSCAANTVSKYNFGPLGKDLNAIYQGTFKSLRAKGKIYQGIKCNQ